MWPDFNKRHFCQNISDVIYEKRPPLKHFNKQFCIHTWSYYEHLCIYSNCMYTKLFFKFNSCPFHKSHHKCFARSSPWLQIRSYIYIFLHALHVSRACKNVYICRYKSSLINIINTSNNNICVLMTLLCLYMLTL